MKHQPKHNKRHKSDNFWSKVGNTFVTICLTVILMWGLQACSHTAALRFIQLSDVHFLENGSNTTFKMIGESPGLLDDAVSQINEQKDIDFVMITGDLIDKPFEKELRAVLPHLGKLNYPWYFAFGNHDRCVGGYLDTNVYLKMLREANPNFKFERAYYSFVPKKGYRVIVLDDIITNEITSQGYVDPTQLKWLKKQLDKAGSDTVLIFMHAPVIEPFASPNHRLRNASQVMSLIESYKNPIGVFQGHYHATRVVQHNNVLYIDTPALVSYPNAFRLVSVENFKNKTVFELKWFETREKTIQKMAKIMVMVSSIYTGEEKDRNGVYEIKRD
ncbi:MAG: metallophosphoesterase [Cyanobacteriota bacterium]|nr:metallophosphoesterase [Cyanobacteriota bacterium]